MARFKLSDRARRNKARKRRRRALLLGQRHGHHRRGHAYRRGHAPAYRSAGYSAGSSRRIRAALPEGRPALARRASAGVSAGASLHRAVAVGKRVPPPRRPNGYLGGRGTGYRYPGSRRVAQVGKSDLVDVGTSKCVPCSEVARMARG